MTGYVPPRDVHFLVGARRATSRVTLSCEGFSAELTASGARDLAEALVNAATTAGEDVRPAVRALLDSSNGEGR